MTEPAKVLRRQRHLRIEAERAMAAANLQWSRCFDETRQPEDLTFWLVSVVILRRVACLTRDTLSTLDTEPIREAIDRFDSAAPEVRPTRDRLEHPASELGLFSLGSGFVRPGPGGELEYVVDVERDHVAAEELYRSLVDFLGPLPAKAGAYLEQDPEDLF